MSWFHERWEISGGSFHAVLLNFVALSELSGTIQADSTFSCCPNNGGVGAKSSKQRVMAGKGSGGKTFAPKYLPHINRW